MVDVRLGIWYNSVEFSPISGASALQRGADFSGGKAFFLLSIILPVGSPCRKAGDSRRDSFFGIMARQMEIECPPEETVVKSNQLVKAKTPFTKLEHRVVAALIAQLEKDQNDFGMQTVSLRGITEMSGYNSTDLFRNAKRLCDNLVEKSVGVQSESTSGERTYRALPIFNECQYVEQEGVIKAEFNRKMKPLLLQLKKRFTMYWLPYYLRLPSRHSMRIYELLKMREGLRTLRISVQEFREILGIEDKYKQFSTMRHHVIEKSRERIAEFTDVRFTYEVERDGRTPVGLRFFIHDQEAEGRKQLGDRERNTEYNYDTGEESDLRFDVRTLFLQNRTQAEIEALDEEEVTELYETTKALAQEKNPGAGASVLASETLRLMERKWKEAT